MAKSLLGIKQLVLVLAIFPIFSLMLLPPASAHSPIEKRFPQANEIVETSPSVIDLWFEEPVEVFVGSVQIRSEENEAFLAGKPEQDPENRRHVTATITQPLLPGKYTVYIDVIGQDGHPIREDYIFTVAEPKLSEEEMFSKLELEKSVPADGTIVESSPQVIDLWFTQPAELTVFGLLNDQQLIMPSHKPVVDPDNPAHYTIEIKDALKKGTYSIFWNAKIGDNVKGGTEYFALGEVTSIVGGIDRDGVSIVEQWRMKSVANWLSFMGLLTLAGGAWFVTAIAGGRGNLPRWNKFSFVLYGIAILGFILELIANRVEFATVPLQDFIGLHIVWIPALQLALLAGGYCLKWNRLRLVIFYSAMALWAFTGHSTSQSYGGELAIGVDLLHLLAVSIWLGGLTALVVMTPGDHRAAWFKEAGKAYSKWAVLSVIVIATTGIWMSMDYVPSFTLTSMLESTWGKMLSVKIVLFIGIIVLGYYQRRSLRNFAENAVFPFLKRARIELVIAAAVLLAAGLLIDLSPKEAEQSIYPEVVTSDGVEARVEIAPFQIGANDITISFANDPGYKEVSVRLTAIPDWSVENTAFSLGGGKYRLTGNFIHGAGTILLEVRAMEVGGKVTVFPFKIQVPGVMDY
jgi:copper transport protein